MSERGMQKATFLILTALAACRCPPPGSGG
jgi:hypothetical protein